MFEKIIGGLFNKSEKKKGITVLSEKREINDMFGATEKTYNKSDRETAFWENRGKGYGALFTSLNGRTF